MANNIDQVIYTENYRLNASLVEVFRFYFVIIKKYRQFIWVNFLKYFKASYQQSAFRMLWRIILPLVPVSVYIIMQVLGVLKGASDMPRSLYVVIGMTFWQLMANSINLTMNAPIKDRAMLKKINMPFILFYLSALGDVIFDYLIRVVLIWLLMIILKVDFRLAWLVLPLLGFPFILIGFTAGVFFSFFSIFFNDIKNIVDICIRYGLFASAVIFPIPDLGYYTNLLKLNPIYICIENLRHYVYFGELVDLQGAGIVISVSLLFFVFVMKKLYSLEPRMREFL